MKIYFNPFQFLLWRWRNPLPISNKNQLGIALKEAVILIPVIIMLSLLLVDSGRAIGNLIWIARIPFATSSAGAEADKKDFYNKMRTRYELVTRLANEEWRNHPVSVTPLPTPTVFPMPANISPPLRGDNRFLVESKAPVAMPLFKVSGVLKLSPSAILPILSRQKDNPNNLAMFENKKVGTTEILYSCSGMPTGSSSSCVTCPVTGPCTFP